MSFCEKLKITIILMSFFCRLTPKNLHQRPTVALLCGPHVQGAQGISCGRHLANHEVEVVLFLPNFVKMLEAITSELTLFGKTGGKQVSSVKGTGFFLCFTCSEPYKTWYSNTSLKHIYI